MTREFPYVIVGKDKGRARHAARDLRKAIKSLSRLTLTTRFLMAKAELPEVENLAALANALDDGLLFTDGPVDMSDRDTWLDSTFSRTKE